MSIIAAFINSVTNLAYDYALKNDQHHEAAKVFLIRSDIDLTVQDFMMFEL
ncbi:hypothetical protein [Psychroserpens luteolus]|uniref:hypothetical protein n=1 Tax=Psychroserpens luteolus TaxID=2855840 RepID=UPI001E4FA5E2|nr:hypothetical protein [Psychroserpens luteolus]MCD2260125.1 hypothetical protein [Psychroserpens luteolus]